MVNRRRTGLVFGLVVCVVLVACLPTLLRSTSPDWSPRSALASGRASVPAPREACDHADPLRQAFFGDLHVHTFYSMDARSRGMLGTPNDAYRFATGERTDIGPWDADGVSARTSALDRPLDFAAVTDHAEWMGEVNLCSQPGSKAYDTGSCRRFRGEEEPSIFHLAQNVAGQMGSIIGARSRVTEICGPGDAWCRESIRSAWQETQSATERWNDTSSACRFTALHGWEYSNSAGLSKVHRNVIFRNADVPELPLSSLEFPTILEMWDRLDEVCTNTDSECAAVTIPHNPNVSNGRIFEVTWRGESLEEQRRQARLSARMDRVVEIMQAKGESECKNGMWRVVGGEDELCDFEKMRQIGDAAPADCKEGTGSGAVGGRGCQSRVDFARYALIEGMREQERIGVNAFQFGFIGSTDQHIANPGDTEEYSYDGTTSSGDTTALERLGPEIHFAGRPEVARNPGGLMGVWSEENSRDSIFDAIERRETFATSGPRIAPRFFAGWDLPADLCEQPDWVSTGYATGVPMGTVLDVPAAQTASPRFLASVSRDPGITGHPGGALDRLQIIKVWLGDDGLFNQQVHDIAGRVASDTLREAPRVDLGSCAVETEASRRGADSLCAVWSDPEFDAGQNAAYYVRVVEDPSCRWSWRQCLTIPEDERPEACRDPQIPKTIQERAWTSPIWIEKAS